jgi:hypothetical protein
LEISKEDGAKMWEKIKEKLRKTDDNSISSKN